MHRISRFDPRRRLLTSSEDGFSLLEIVISGFIVSVSVVGLALMYSLGQSFVSAEGHERVALYLAEKRIEELRSIGLSQAASEPEAPIPGFTDFYRSTTITNGTDSDGSGLTPRTITVSVRSIVRQAGPVTVQTTWYPH